MGKKTGLKIKELVENAIPNSKVIVENKNNDGIHFKIIVSSKAFNGKSILEQHRMVNAPLVDLLKKEVHALAINTIEEN